MGMSLNGMRRVINKFNTHLTARDECKVYYYVVQATNQAGEERYICSESDQSFARVRPAGLSWANVVRSDDACELEEFVYELKQELKLMENGTYPEDFFIFKNLAGLTNYKVVGISKEIKVFRPID